MTEVISSEQEKAKQAWLGQLSNFIVEANLATWAGDGKEVTAQRPGYKELEYVSQDGKWKLRDSYTGYFRAPGMTTVYYKGTPAWTMSYGGHGQTEEYYGIAKPTYEFLKASLRRVTPEMPFRGPKECIEGNKKYEFEILEGDIEDGLWRERITEDGIRIFGQIGIMGLVINKDSNLNPIYPWNL